MSSVELWRPSASVIEQSNLTAFQKVVEERLGKTFEDYHALHAWSILENEAFWSAVWEFTNVISTERGEHVLEQSGSFQSARWFPGAMLNFAENLLWRRDNKLALIERLETGQRRTRTYSQLYDEVSSLAAALRSAGVESGDRIAGYMPNVIETVVGMLAATSIGAIWSSCSPDFGFDGARDRFGQISPKILLTVNAYAYNGKVVDCQSKAETLADAIPSIEKVVVVDLIANDALHDTRETTLGSTLCRYDDLIESSTDTPLIFTQLPFDHPLYIMYSSGTTGTPKCIVHGAGGTLLQHKKEHALHCDLKQDDVLFYFTTCGWMMWNWLVSGLATGATVVLYEGSPFALKGHALLNAIDEEGISVFGVGAKFIASLEKSGIKPRDSHRLTTLKTILSTGSPLGAGSFDYVYRDFKVDVCLSSISGGTDILSCFVLGNPNLPVCRGEIQCVGLGMAVEIWNDDGESIKGCKGELVCTQPFPSAPIGFWNDDDGSRYRAAYFEKYSNVWAHGDYGELMASGGVIIHGRSDAVLNPGGVRIGTAEIYRQVERLNAVLDSVVVGQRWGDDERVVLFVVLRDGIHLTDELKAEIKQLIRIKTTPRHVPSVILQVSDIPRTISGKISELAVKRIIHGESVKNTDALANPEALENFMALTELER